MISLYLSIILELKFHILVCNIVYFTMESRLTRISSLPITLYEPYHECNDMFIEVLWLQSRTFIVNNKSRLK